MRVSAEVTGVEQTIRAIGAAKAKTTKTVAELLQKCGEVILKKAKELCPVETGALRDSGRIEVTGTGMGTRVNVQFGGPAAPYALYVHENLEAKHASPTTAQWVTHAVRATRGTTASIAKRELEIG